MSGCEEVKERLCEFLDGELDSSARAGVESHIQSCTACREELQALRSASSAVHALEKRAAPASILAGIRAGIKEAPPAPVNEPVEAPPVLRPQPSAWWRRVMSAAAVLIVAALIYVAYIPNESTRQASAPAQPRAAERSATATPSPAPKASQDSLYANTQESKPSAGFAVTPMEEAAEQALVARAESKRKVDEALNATDSTANKSDLEPAPAMEALPQAPSSAPVGTPPNVAEGRAKGLSNQPVLQQLKEGLNDLAARRESKSAEKDSNQDRFGTANDVAQVDDATQQQETPKVQANEPPTQKVIPEQRAPAAVSPNKDIAQAEAVNRDGQERQVLEIAEARREETLKRPAAPAKTSTPFRGNQDAPELGAGAQQSGMAPRQQVLSIRRQDLARVLQDLKQMAASSGGDMAWMPADKQATALKKEVQAKTQTMQVDSENRVVIRVPQDRLTALVQATRQYQAQSVLNLEAAERAKADQRSFKAERPDAKAAETGPQTDNGQQAAAGKRDETGEEYVQLLVEFLPTSVADASKARQAPAADVETEPGR